MNFVPKHQVLNKKKMKTMKHVKKKKLQRAKDFYRKAGKNLNFTKEYPFY